MSMETKCPHAEKFLWWNVCAEITWILQFNLSIWLTLVRSWKPFVASRRSSKSIRSRLLTTKKKYDPWGSVQLVQKWFHLFLKILKWQQISICKCEKYVFAIWYRNLFAIWIPSSNVYLLTLTKNSNVKSIFISDVKFFSHLQMNLILSFQVLT